MVQLFLYSNYYRLEIPANSEKNKKLYINNNSTILSVYSGRLLISPDLSLKHIRTSKT